MVLSEEDQLVDCFSYDTRPEETQSRNTELDEIGEMDTKLCVVGAQQQQQPDLVDIHVSNSTDEGKEEKVNY